MDISGSLQKLIVNGVTYRIHGDSDSTNKIGKYENEAMATTGDNIIKKTIRAQIKEGIDVACNRAEMEILKSVSDSTDEVPLVLVYADGSKDIGSGTINLGDWSSMDNKASISLIPKNEFEAFTA